jgi:hypothetical protein
MAVADPIRANRERSVEQSRCAENPLEPLDIGVAKAGHLVAIRVDDSPAAIVPINR